MTPIAPSNPPAPRARLLPLRARILIAVGSLVAAILVVSGAVNVAEGHRDRLDALQLRAALVASAQAAAVASPIWEYDEEAGLAALRGVLDDPELVEAIVTDDTGRTFARVARAGSPSPEEILTVRKDVQITAPTGGLRTIGGVELRFSRAVVDAKLHDALLFELVVLFVLVLTVTIGILLALRRFTKPLEELTGVLDKRSRGDLSGDVDRAWLARDDEIGAIARSIELDQQQRRDEAKLLDITSNVSAEAHVGTFLTQISAAAAELLGAAKCTVFVHDRKRDVLWSVGHESADSPRIELRSGEGHAGESFATGQVVKLDGPPHAVLCVPLNSRGGGRVGVIEVTDRKGGPFGDRDVLRLRSLAAQAAVALENARLLEDVLDEKAYSESILASLSDGVVTLDKGRGIARVNASAARILEWREGEVRGRTLRELLPHEENDFEVALIDRVAGSGRSDSAVDAELMLPGDKPRSVNLNAAPLTNADGEAIGTLVVFEDITDEKRVRSTMARYLPTKVVDQLLKGDRGMLGGSSQTITSLFSDIRSFTTISEAIGPRETVTMLNEYFTEMLEVLDRHNGVLDKFIGDAVMALFGVPFAGDSDADNAVAAANDMLRSLARLNVVRKGRGQAAVEIGIGINTGEAIAGNIGSPRRMSYTVVGDSVNLASRLEGATKNYGTPILISGFTFDALKHREYLREVDVLRVKGKTLPVAVYESYAWRDDRDDASVREAMALSTKAVEAFRQRRFKEAREAFDAVRGHLPGDPLPDVYEDRMVLFDREPPPDDWDGVFTMHHK